jgi:hypothetical protein
MFTGRTGSSYLISMLVTHPQIAAVGEHLVDFQGEGAEAQIHWAKEFLTPPIIGRHRAIGFKTKLIDILDPDGFAHLLRQLECNIVHMNRQNRIKAVVSRINSLRLYEATDQWNLFSEEDRLQSRMTIDPEQFESFLQHKEKIDRELEIYVDHMKLPTLKIYYEDLISDKEGTLENLFSFLGVSSHPVRSATFKNTKDNLREVIANFDEIRFRYLGTPYEPMFDEILLS